MFCRTLQLPDDPQEAVHQSLRALRQGLVQPVGLGSANERFFLFHTGIGFDAAVVEQVERQGDLKRYLNHPLFVYAAVKTWLRHYDRSRPAFSVYFDDGEDDTVNDGYFMICQNTDPYTYLGNLPLRVAPSATLDRGLTAVTLTSLRSDRLIRLVGDALRPPAGLATSDTVDHRTDLKKFVVRAHRPVPLQLDGDFVGTVDEVRFAHHPDALLLARTDFLESAELATG